MNFEVFETKFLLNLNNESKNCFSLIDENGKIIEEYLGEKGDKKIIDKFVSKINVVVLAKKNFSFIKKVLEHPALTNVLYNFRNSDILIQACSTGNIAAIRWLLTMNIDPFVQDDNGMTALMHAVKNNVLIFVVTHFINNEDCLNIVNKKSENVLFYALCNSQALLELTKSKIDVNQRNENNETAFLYCCKNELYEAAVILLHNEHIDVNCVDNDGRSAAMYLAEKGRYTELKALKKKNCDINYMNVKMETPLSLLIKNLYSNESSNKKDLYLRYINTLTTLLDLGCDFNLPVDEDENTAIMVFIIVKDFKTLEYVLKHTSNADIAKKNRGGENATSLFIKSSSHDKCKFIVDESTFDFTYVDGNNYNTLLMLACINKPTLVSRIVKRNSDSINYVNNKYESALILATKSKNIIAVNELLKFDVLVDQQDYLGNTALYYAVEMNNIPVIKNLVNKNANPNIKNNEGRSPLDLAHENGNKTVLNLLTNTSLPYTKSSSSPSSSPYPQSSSPYPRSSSSISLNPPSYEECTKNINEECTKNNSKRDSGVIVNKKYSDIEEYLYPWITNNYQEFKMKYEYEVAAGVVFRNAQGGDIINKSSGGYSSSYRGYSSYRDDSDKILIADFIFNVAELFIEIFSGLLDD